MPIRWRLTLMFAAVMAVLLAGLIAFLYHHFRSDLDYNINQSLSARAQDIAGLVRQEDATDTSGALHQLPASPDNVVQVLDQSGRVLGAAGVLSQPALLSPGELPTAQEGPRLLQRGSSLRLYALPLANDHKVVVAFGQRHARAVAGDPGRIRSGSRGAAAGRAHAPARRHDLDRRDQHAAAPA